MDIRKSLRKKIIDAASEANSRAYGDWIERIEPETSEKAIKALESQLDKADKAIEGDWKARIMMETKNKDNTITYSWYLIK